MLGLVLRCGIIYDVKPRSSGSSKWGFIRLLDLAITGITSFPIGHLGFGAW